MLVKVLSGKDFKSPKKKLLWITVILAVVSDIDCPCPLFFSSHLQRSWLGDLSSDHFLSDLFSYLFIFPHLLPYSIN